MKRILAPLFILAALTLATPARAQGGCANCGGCAASPENPTAFLALAGIGGAALANLRARRR